MLTLPESKGDLLSTLNSIHSWALHRFVYVPDEVKWANSPDLWIQEHWETNAEIWADLEGFGTLEGDCDAFAKLCWLLCRRLQIPSRLVFCKTETKGSHLVCEASGWILDNRQPTVTSNTTLEENIGYTWVSKSGFEPGQQWTTC